MPTSKQRLAGEAFGRMGNYEFWMSLKPNSFKKCKQRREEDAALTGGSIVSDVLKENSVAGGEPDGELDVGSVFHTGPVGSVWIGCRFLGSTPCITVIPALSHCGRGVQRRRLQSAPISTTGRRDRGGDERSCHSASRYDNRAPSFEKVDHD